jgi:WD40 repeat protein
MAAGSEQNIKLWQIESEQITDLQTLIGHTQLINCLVFSRRVNWFVSGSSDSTIRGWKE